MSTVCHHPTVRVYRTNAKTTLRVTMQSVSISQPRGAIGENPPGHYILSNLRHL